MHLSRGDLPVFFTVLDAVAVGGVVMVIVMVNWCGMVWFSMVWCPVVVWRGVVWRVVL